MGFKEKLKSFEAMLDARLAQCSFYHFDANETLGFLAHLSDVHAQQNPTYNNLDAAITIIAPHLVSGKIGGKSLDVKSLMADVEFCSSYYMLREYLYYSYNVPDAFGWLFGKNEIEVRFSDKSIPRQFFTSDNDTVLGSTHHFKNNDLHREIRCRVASLDEWGTSDSTREVWQMVEDEATHKLSAYFSLINQDGDLDFGGFTYAEFFKLYHMLVSKALWHRHHAAVKGEHGAVVIDEEDLIEAASSSLGFEKKKIGLILRDLIFDEQAVMDGLDASYFSLLQEAETKRIWMRPIHFSLHEGLVGFLRVVAKRRSQVFLKKISQPLGDAFVRRVKASFEEQGFRCRSDVKLSAYDEKLPDIDLMVISEEPTLGYVLLICELKSPVPAQWAKDHLRALNADGVSKAFQQSRKIAEFLASEGGVNFLLSLLPPGGLPDYDHFLVVVEPLIVTSHNSGIFFDNEPTPVFNFRTLERMLTASDGDMAYIQHMIGSYGPMVDQTLKTAMRETMLGDVKVRFEVVADSPSLSFPPNQWRSSQERAQLVEEFRRSGAKPVDTIANLLQLRRMQIDSSSDLCGEAQEIEGRLVVLVDRSLDGGLSSTLGSILSDEIT